MDPEEDLAALDALFDVVTECDGHRPIGEHKYLDLLQPDNGFGGLVGEVDGELVAYLAVGYSSETNTCAIEIALHPLHRQSGHLECLVEAGVGHARARGADMVRMWAFQPNYVEALLSMGFHEERELRQVRRPLPYPGESEFPDGFELRAFRPGIDEEAWLAVNGTAFAGHPENGSWTIEVLEDREAQPWFDPEGFLMAWSGDELAGFCWTKRHNGMGEIYVIAVAPKFQGRSLGRALVIEGMHGMARRGMTTAMLYMDASNTRAAALYESLEFRLDHVDRSLVRSI